MCRAIINISGNVKKEVLQVTQYPPAHSCKYYGLMIFWLTVDQVLVNRQCSSLLYLTEVIRTQPTDCQLHSADIGQDLLNV